MTRNVKPAAEEQENPTLNHETQAVVVREVRDSETSGRKQTFQSIHRSRRQFYCEVFPQWGFVSRTGEPDVLSSFLVILDCCNSLHKENIKEINGLIVSQLYIVACPGVVVVVAVSGSGKRQW